MYKKFILKIIILLIVILCFIAGMMAYKKINSAALFSPLSAHMQCVNQKCASVKGLGINMCSANSDCRTHMQCNNREQCVAFTGAGSDKCSIDKDCSISDPQKWCEENNPGAGLIVAAQVYPGGNFSCNCEYEVAGKISQTPCTNSHLN